MVTSGGRRGRRRLRGLDVILPAFIVAFGVTAALSPPVGRLLRRLEVLDVPNERSSHLLPTTRGGGLAPAGGALIAVVAFRPALGSISLSLGLAGALFAAIGFSDDLRGLSVARRLGLQAVASAGVAVLLLRGTAVPGLVMALIAIVGAVWLVALVNVSNFMDGINGLAAGHAALAGATWCWLGQARHIPTLTVGAAILCGAALGFLPSNFPRARVFLGDVGSYFLGAWMAILAVVAWRSGLPAEAVAGPLVLWAADTSLALLRRISRGEAWWLPHREHVYQRLVGLGWSHVRTALSIGALVTVCSALGASSLGASFPERAAVDATTLLVVVAYLCLPYLVPRFGLARLAGQTQ